jgi:hypothetical protein
MTPRHHSDATHLLVSAVRTLPHASAVPFSTDSSSHSARRLDIPAGRIAFVILRTSASPQVAFRPHLAVAPFPSWLRAGERLPGKDSHLRSYEPSSRTSAGPRPADPKPVAGCNVGPPGSCRARTSATLRCRPDGPRSRERHLPPTSRITPEARPPKTCSLDVGLPTVGLGSRSRFSRGPRSRRGQGGPRRRAKRRRRGPQPRLRES